MFLGGCPCCGKNGTCWRCYRKTDDDYQCFDAPPDEDGWEPLGKCHATEAECSQACPPVPCDEPCDAPFQIAGYIAKAKAEDWKEAGGTVGSSFPGGPTITGSIQSSGGSVTFASFVGGVLLDGLQNTNESSRDVIFAIAASQNRYPSYPLECIPTECVTTIDYAPMKDPANKVLIEAQSYSPAFNSPAGTSGIIELRTGMARVIGSDSDKRVLLRSCSFGGVDYTNTIDPSVPATFAPIIRFVHDPWCAADIPSGLGFGQVFYVPHSNWGGNLKIKFDVVNSNNFDDIIFSHDFEWSWQDSFMQPDCGTECTPPGGRTMPTSKTGGPGTELKKLLGSFGFRSKEKGCGCRSMQKKMDTKGPQWCRDNLESVILPHLAKEARKRKLPFIKLAARRAVELAIRRAEKNST